jgi:Cu/Ag efflux pump CusA
LGDVAMVVEDHQPLIGDAVRDAGPSLLLVVEKFPGANTLDVTRGLESTLNTLKPGLSGVDVDTTVFRPATFIETAMGSLAKTLLIGAGLAALILLALLFRWRVALVSLLAIPLSFAAAVLVLHLRGATLNVMTLAGLIMALGVIVDDAVVDPENIARRLNRRRDFRGKSATTVLLDAVIETRRPLVFATLVAVVVTLPVFFLTGVSGGLFQPLAISYVLALLASLLVALVLTPALSRVLVSPSPRENSDAPYVRWLQERYGPAVTWLLRRSFVAYAVGGILVVAALAVSPMLRLPSLLPTFREPQLMISWEGAPGASHTEMTRITTDVVRELRALPGVSNVGAHIGRAVLGDEVVGINAAKIWVSIAPTANYDETIVAVKRVVAPYPGLVREVRTYLNKTLREVLTGSRDSIVVRIFGPDWAALRGKAQEVQAALSSIDGVVDLRSELQIEEPHVEIQVDFARSQRYGLNPGDVRRAASTLVNGLEVGSLFEQQKVFEVVVWSTPETRRSVTSLRELLIDTPGGGRVRLEDVADVRVTPTLNVIDREASSRRLDVSLDVQGRDPGAVASDVERALRGISFPLEYHAELLGEYTERQAAQQRIVVAAIVAAIGAFLLVQGCFQSWRLATLAFFTLPWAVVGGLLAAALAGGGTLSLGSLVGLLTVLGIATRNGIMLISHFQHLEDEEGQPFGPALVVRGARERLAPILMTALATGLALVPLAIAGNTPGHEIEHPMAIVILGGLITSTVLNLFVLPSLYLRFGNRVRLSSARLAAR